VAEVELLDPLALLDVDELLEDVEPVVAPKRLVAARSALDRLFWPPLPPEEPELELLLLDVELELELEVEEDEPFPPERDCTVELALDVLALLEKSRPRPDWLPRNWGVISDTDFSAPVTPLRRTVRSSAPNPTVAVRTAEIAAEAGLA
jgi:hypothetical protein